MSKLTDNYDSKILLTRIINDNKYSEIINYLNNILPCILILCVN